MPSFISNFKERLRLPRLFFRKPSRSEQIHGGPPWICSARDGFRKNNRGRRSRSLKLEINERITGSLSKNNCAGH